MKLHDYYRIHIYLYPDLYYLTLIVSKGISLFFVCANLYEKKIIKGLLFIAFHLYYLIDYIELGKRSLFLHYL